MKKIFAPLVILFLMGIQFTWAQTNCSKYYPMTKGSSFEYTNTNKKGKTEGISSFTVSSVSQEGASSVATINLKYIDKKGKVVFDTNYSITCNGDIVRIDYKSLFPSQMMQQYEDMGLKMDITGTDIELPNNLSVGQELADGNVAVAMNMSGIKMNIAVDMINRKVEKTENVTTPAGTFDCYLITETNRSKTMGTTQEMQSKLWLAEGIGMVKQESYKKNGALISRSELTKYSK